MTAGHRLGPRRPRRVHRRRPRPRDRRRRSIEHTVAGLRDLVGVPGPARRRRGRDRTPRRPRRRHPARRRPHGRGRDRPEPGQEPARPLRLGRQQGRPVRRLRARRHPAHRPRPTAPPGPDTAATVALRRACRPARTWSVTASPQPTSSAPTCATSSPAPSACSPTLDSADQPGIPGPVRPPRTEPTGSPRNGSGDWLAKQGYSGRTDPAVLHQRLLDAPRGVTGDDADHPGPHHRRYVAAAGHPGRADQGPRHPDRPASSTPTPTPTSSPSLPRAGRVRAARLLAEIGDCRAKFPTPESLACLAGAAPSTRQSGKLRSRRPSAGPATSNCATPSPTSPATADTPTPGPPTSTTAPAPAATTIPTPYASWPAPGSTSSGTAGNTASPTSPKPTGAPTHPRDPTRGGLT